MHTAHSARFRRVPAAGIPRLSSPALGCVVGLVLAGMVPTIILMATPQTPGSAYVGPLLIVFLSGLRFAWLVGSGTRRPFEFSLWLFTYVFLGLAAMVQLRMNVDPVTTPGIVHALDWTTSGVILAGGAAAVLGSAIARRPLPKRSTEDGATPRVLSRKRVDILALLMIACAAYYISRIGLASFFLSRTSLSKAARNSWGDSLTQSMATGFVTMGLLVVVVAQILIWQRSKEVGQKRPFFLLWIPLLMLFTVVNPISSPRFLVGTAVFGVLAALGAYRTIRRYRTVALAAIGALVFIFPLADAFRRSEEGDFRSAGFLQTLTQGDFDGFGQISNAVYYTESLGITWGKQLLGVLFFWIPRSIWSDKPVDTGILLAEFRGYDFSNLSAPIFSELYINGGWFGTAIGMLAIGWLLRKLDMRAERQIVLEGQLPLIACILPMYLLLVFRGSLLQSMAFLAVIIVCSWFVTIASARSDGQTLSRMSPRPR